MSGLKCYLLTLSQTQDTLKHKWLPLIWKKNLKYLYFSSCFISLVKWIAETLLCHLPGTNNVGPILVTYDGLQNNWRNFKNWALKNNSYSFLPTAICHFIYDKGSSKTISSIYHTSFFYVHIPQNSREMSEHNRVFFVCNNKYGNNKPQHIWK